MATLRQRASFLSALSHSGILRAVVVALVGLAVLAIGAVLLARHRLVWHPPGDLVKFAKETAAFYRSQPTARADDHAALVRAFSSGAVFYNDDYDENGNSVPQDMR